MNRLRFSDIVLFKKALTIAGCLLFLGSIVFPFCTCREHLGMIPEDIWQASYWSFKVRLTTSWRVRAPVELWFYQEGFFNYAEDSGLLWSLVFILVGQLLTLATGIASILTRRTVFALAPLVLCSSVTVLMTHIILQHYPRFTVYELGYWLTYPSLLLFLLAFILHTVNKRRLGKMSTASSQTH